MELMQADVQYQQPLHVAAAAGASAQVLEVLLRSEHAEMAVRRRIRSGGLPLHVAAQHGSMQALRMLHEAYPEGVFQHDGNGCLPLHVAAGGTSTVSLGPVLLMGGSDSSPASHSLSEEGD